MSDKTRVTLSLPKEVNDTIKKYADLYGLTKSGLVTILVNQLVANGELFK